MPLSYFNSRPHKEVDIYIIVCQLQLYISTHDLTRRSTSIFQMLSFMLIFQLTTSQGGRPLRYSRLNIQSYFNSRPHKEVDTLKVVYYILTKYFNSRPHKEVDNGDDGYGKISDISTHDLTRRSTKWAGIPFLYGACISTHDLTRRSTMIYL